MIGNNIHSEFDLTEGQGNAIFSKQGINGILQGSGALWTTDDNAAATTQVEGFGMAIYFEPLASCTIPSYTGALTLVRYKNGMWETETVNVTSLTTIDNSFGDLIKSFSGETFNYIAQSDGSFKDEDTGTVISVSGISYNPKVNLPMLTKVNDVSGTLAQRVQTGNLFLEGDDVILDMQPTDTTLLDLHTRDNLTLVDKLGNDAAIVGGVVGNVATAGSITFDDLTDIGIVDFKGSAIPKKLGDVIDYDIGSVEELSLTDGSKFYFNGHLQNSEGAVSINHQGLVWDSDTDTYSRIGTIANIPVSTSAGNANLPIQSAMKRCLLLDNGTVNYYLDANNSALKDDGVTASDLTGADGQVMVEIPKFYIRQEYGTKFRYWSISLEQLDGYIVHPAFIKDGVEVDYRYYSAFEGSMYDASAGAMTASASIPSSIYAAGDKMCSVIDQWAKVNETRAEYRAMAAARGTGFRQLDYYLHSAVQLLYLIEYADFNSQAMIGNGRTTLSGGTWTADSYIGKTGLSVADGNNTNSVAIGGSSYATDYMTYRGIENWFGNVWKMIDGLTVDGTWTGVAAAMPMYATNDASKFADATDMGVAKLCDASYIGALDGYSSDIENAIGFIPSAVGASSTTKLTDYYWQYSEEARNYWRAPLFSGNAYSGGLAGGFAFAANAAWSYAYVHFAGRLCF